MVMVKLVSAYNTNSGSNSTLTNFTSDYVWIHPETGETHCWINNLPAPWSAAVGNNDLIASGAGKGRQVFLAVSS